MRYTPMTESEIKSLNVMEAGIYNFEVIEVHTTDKSGCPLQDKNGNDMAKLKLLLWDKNDKQRSLYTYISGDTTFAYKLRHFAHTLGMLTEYEDGTFNINRAVGKSGQAEIIIKIGTLKADGSGEMWPDRNDVKDFIIAAIAVEPESVKFNKSNPHPVGYDNNNDFDQLDDEVPF